MELAFPKRYTYVYPTISEIVVRIARLTFVLWHTWCIPILIFVGIQDRICSPACMHELVNKYLL